MASTTSMPIYPRNATINPNPDQTKQKDMEIFKIVFEAFDKHQNGLINKDDVLAITVSMRKDFGMVN